MPAINQNKKISLQKAIGNSGFCSRRKAEQLIKEGKIKINNEVAILGMKFCPKCDIIKISGKIFGFKTNTVYYIVNKPIGYICTLKDEHADKKISDLIPKSPKTWPVGRLDKDSRGLVIMTNDGDLTYKLTHPKFKHEKEYIVDLYKNIEKDLLEKLEKGIPLKEGIARVDKCEKIGNKKISIIIHQGWNRQIRRMLGKCGYRIMDLQRIRIGNIQLGRLTDGKYKKIIKPKI